MNRSGYSEDCENLDLYRQAVERALKGKRGQAFLREMADALDAMPEKVLIRDEMIDANGDCCAMGAVCIKRKLDLGTIDYFDTENVAVKLGIAQSMAREIAYMNDEVDYKETPQERWARMRKWISKNIKENK